MSLQHLIVDMNTQRTCGYCGEPCDSDMHDECRAKIDGPVDYRLRWMPKKFLGRLLSKAIERMKRGDGYQPFGYDFRTLNITKPTWANLINQISDAYFADREPVN